MLVVHQSSVLYGSDRMLLRLAATLSASHTLCIHLPHDGPLVDHLRSVTANIVIAPTTVLRLNRLKRLSWLNPVAFWRNMVTAHRLLQRHDGVLVNCVVLLNYLLLLPFYKKPKYVYVHELPQGVIKAGLNILLWASGAILVCNSRATALAYPLVKSTRKHIVYNCMPPTGPVPTLHADSKSLHLLFLGRIAPRKGLHVFLQALHELTPAERAKIRVRIVGDSYEPDTRYARRINTMVKSLQASVAIETRGFTVDPVDEYAWAHVVVVPSVKPESFGLVALEAAYHRRAVIASAVGALPEIVTQGVTGLVIAPVTPSALSQAIRHYLSQPDDVARHGINGHTDASNRFRYESYQHTLRTVIP